MRLVLKSLGMTNAHRLEIDGVDVSADVLRVVLTVSSTEPTVAEITYAVDELDVDVDEVRQP